MSSATSQPTPTVFVVDDDVSARESLELLTRFAGWEPEVFASAREFLARPRTLTPSRLVLDVSGHAVRRRLVKPCSLRGRSVAGGET